MKGFIDGKEEFYKELTEISQKYINGTKQISRKEIIDVLLEYADALQPIERYK